MKYVLYLFFFLSLSVNAQKNYVIKYKGHSAKASTYNNPAKNNFSQNIKNLASRITKGKYEEAEKAKAIYLWIAQNIGYDHELRFNKQLQKDYYTSKEKIILKVLQNKKALCGGYAFLFETLCQQVGVEAKTIHGFTKLSPSLRQPNHSWNAVKVNGQWQLLDITWSVSNGSQNGPDKYWYFTNPEIFIRSHYPQEKKWALIDNPPSLIEFVS